MENKNGHPLRNSKKESEKKSVLDKFGGWIRKKFGDDER